MLWYDYVNIRRKQVILSYMKIRLVKVKIIHSLYHTDLKITILNTTLNSRLLQMHYKLQ